MEMPDEKVIEIFIRYDVQAGKMDVKAPLHDKVLCYGMLEMAKEIISKHEIKKEVPLVVPVGNVLNLKAN